MEEISLHRGIYLIVFLSSFIVGCSVYRYHRALRILLAVMLLGLITELLVELNKHLPFSSEPIIYNIYIPIEYLLYAGFFYCINTNTYLRKAIVISIPLFVIAFLLLEVFQPASLIDLATRSYTISGVLITTWSVWTLFILPPLEGIKIIRHPLLWICAGLIVFYSGITPFNLVYDAIITSDSFKPLSSYIQIGFNIFLYLSLIVGFVCSNRLKT